MSADNWTYCPVCAKEWKGAVLTAQEEATTSYGKVPFHVFVGLQADALRLAQAPTPRETTLREDYEIETKSDGIFYVSYSCSCSVCGFHFEFNHTEKVLLIGKPIGRAEP